MRRMSPKCAIGADAVHPLGQPEPDRPLRFLSRRAERAVVDQVHCGWPRCRRSRASASARPACSRRPPPRCAPRGRCDPGEGVEHLEEEDEGRHSMRSAQLSQRSLAISEVSTGAAARAIAPPASDSVSGRMRDIGVGQQQVSAAAPAAASAAAMPWFSAHSLPVQPAGGPWPAPPSPAGWRAPWRRPGGPRRRCRRCCRRRPR